MTSFQVFPTIGHATAVAAAADHGNLNAQGRKSRSGNWYSVKELRHVQVTVSESARSSAGAVLGGADVRC